MEKAAYKSNELFFIITPPRAIAEYVAFLKSHVKSAIGHSFEDEFSKAHISLFKFQDEHAEDLLYRIDSKVSECTPFHVHIKNLNFLDDGVTRTIYLEVVHKNPICEIVENVLDQRADFTPYITIARNLEINDFMKAWRSLKNLSYSDYFRCDHITVLKKAPRPARRSYGVVGKWIHYIDLKFAA